LILLGIAIGRDRMTDEQAIQAAKDLMEYISNEMSLSCIDLDDHRNWSERRHTLLYIVLEKWLDE